ncbi:MAG: hypothetical protein HUU46_14975 [Candidatus Hydrogenedentes bacterium]|nr:hypothetical protein [Candidatus Hydrogenedentota bacterium]
MNMSKPADSPTRIHIVRLCITAFAIVWATQIYGVVGNSPVLAWLYVPLLIVCTFRVSLWALAFMCALVANEVGGGRFPIAELGTAVQAVFLLDLAWRRTVLRPAPALSTLATAYLAFQRVARTCFILVSIILVTSLTVRGVPALVSALWAVSMLTVGLSIPAKPRFRWKAAAGTALVTVLSTVISGAVLEMGARILFPMAKPIPPVSVYDPDTWWTLGPNSHGEFQFPTNPLGAPKTMGTFTADTSSQGLRDRDYGPKQPGEYRILLIGDSFTYGWGVNEDDMISRRLEAHLNSAGGSRKFTVMNGGDEGYGPWQERIRLNKIGFLLEPDLVIAQLFPANDVDNSLAKIGKHMRAYSTTWQQILENRRHWGAWQVRAHEWFRRHSAVYNQLLVTTGKPALLVETLDAIRFLEPSRIPPAKASVDRPFWLEIQLKDWYDELNEGQAILESDVLGMREDCRARGVDFLVYTVPDINSVCDFSWEWNMNSVEDPAIYERGVDIAITGEFYARENLDYIDLPAAMLAHPDPCELYFGNDGHLTPKGTDFAARTIAAYLLADASPINNLDSKIPN